MPEKEVKKLIEFEEDCDYSIDSGERLLYSKNLDPFRIFIRLEDGKLNYVSLDFGFSYVTVYTNGEMEISDRAERYITTTAEEAIDNHWLKNAVKTIWNAVK